MEIFKNGNFFFTCLPNFSLLNSYVPLVILYLLSKNPESLKQLQDEVSPLVHCGQFDMRKSYTVLDSTIKESLRLMPPIPNGAQMQTPPLGLRIGESWIPGGSIVKVPFYTLFRGQAFAMCDCSKSYFANCPQDERYFKDPESFVPERWTTKKEMVRNADACIPFLIGNHVFSFLKRWTNFADTNT